MTEEFVTYDIALKLKEKGFSEKCLYHYFDNKLVSNTCKSDNDNITTEDLLMSCNYLVSQFDTAGSNVVVSDAPTISQVLKWLREKKKLHVSIMTFMFKAGWCYEVIRIGDSPALVAAHSNSYNTYEEAAIAGIEYVVDNLI